MPIEAIAITKMTATGMSVSCSGVLRSLNGTSTTGPNGMTANARKAGNIAISGAIEYTVRSAWVGVMPSLKNSLMPSASVIRIPCGPARIGPSRVCMSAITLRSIQM